MRHNNKMQQWDATTQHNSVTRQNVSQQHDETTLRYERKPQYDVTTLCDIVT